MIDGIEQEQLPRGCDGAVAEQFTGHVLNIPILAEGQQRLSYTAHLAGLKFRSSQAIVKEAQHFARPTTVTGYNPKDRSPELLIAIIQKRCKFVARE
jgi:hypothetical protein